MSMPAIPPLALLGATVLTLVACSQAPRAAESAPLSADSTAERNLSGSWAFNQRASDRPMNRPPAGMPSGGAGLPGGGGGFGGAGGGVGGGRGRGGAPVGLDRGEGGPGGTVPPQEIRITETDSTLTFVRSDGRREVYFTDGRPVARGADPEGEVAELVSRWEGPRFVVRRQTRMGAIVESWQLDVRKRQLVMHRRLERGGGGRAAGMETRWVFDFVTR